MSNQQILSASSRRKQRARRLMENIWRRNAFALRVFSVFSFIVHSSLHNCHWLTLQPSRSRTAEICWANVDDLFGFCAALCFEFGCLAVEQASATRRPLTCAVGGLVIAFQNSRDVWGFVHPMFSSHINKPKSARLDFAEGMNYEFNRIFISIWIRELLMMRASPARFPYVTLRFLPDEYRSRSEASIQMSWRKFVFHLHRHYHVARQAVQISTPAVVVADVEHFLSIIERRMFAKCFIHNFLLTVAVFASSSDHNNTEREVPRI